MFPGFRPEHFIGLAIYAVLAGVRLCIGIVICLFLFSYYKRVPAQFRKMEPGLVWLLLIPCFNFVWNFFVFIRLPKSLQAYFASVGNSTAGDCGEGLGLAYSICEVAVLIPCLGLAIWIAAIVLLILYLVKANELTKQIPAVT
jgi:uncharacterized membrane protein